MMTLTRYQQTYGLLHDDGGSDLDWQEVLLNANENPNVPAWSLINRNLHLIIVLCIFGKYDDAARHAETVADAVFSLGPPGSYHADFTMFRGLAHAHLAQSTSGAARRRHRRIARECRSQLQRWARDAQDVRHMSQLLEAELARLRGKSRDALRIYRSAVRLATSRGFLHHSALIHERTATLLRHMRASLESASALNQAIELYREWGALAVVRMLEERRREERCTDLGIAPGAASTPRRAS
jgi:hypothetical protein